jgi:hypothetical protein
MGLPTINPVDQALLHQGCETARESSDEAVRQVDVGTNSFFELNFPASPMTYFTKRASLFSIDRRRRHVLRYARLRHQAAVEDVDSARRLDRALFQKLAAGGWIDAHQNLILCGPTGLVT